MKNVLVQFMALLLVAALNAVAQDSSSSMSSQSAAQSEREPLQAPKANGFWDGDQPSLASLFAHPFATKKYVQRYTVPIRDRVNELDEITSENASRIKDLDARSQKGMQLASEKVSLADQHASDADSKAQLAHKTATQASTKVSTAEQMVASVDEYKGGAQTEIRFRAGQSMLSTTAKDALDQIAAPLKNERNYIIEIQGFSSGHGQAAIASSQKMSESVVRYLVLTHHIPVYRIYTTNLGNVAVPGAGAKRMTGGRLEVSVLKNNLSAANQ